MREGGLAGRRAKHEGMARTNGSDGVDGEQRRAGRYSLVEVVLWIVLSEAS